MPLVRILSILLVGFVSLGLIRYLQLTQIPQQTQTRPAPVRQPTTLAQQPHRLSYSIHRSRTVDERSALTPRNALAKLREQYRLPPDRRFILALLEMQQLVAPQNGSNIELRFEAGEWRILQDNKQLGRLDEFPDFPSARQLLFELSEKLLPSVSTFAVAGTAPSVKLEGFSVLKAQQRLQTLNRQWQEGAHDFNLILQAADAMTRLSWAARDLLETQDNVMARAFALIVLAERGLQRPLPRLESMLADAMGYHTQARRLAEQLPQDDAWRLYILEETALLAEAAQTKEASADAVDLWLMQLANDDRHAEWSVWFQRHYGQERAPIYAMQTAYSLRGFYPKTVTMRLMPMMISAANAPPVQPGDKWLALTEKIAKNLPLGRLALLTEILTDLLRSDPSIKPDQVLGSIDDRAGDYAGPFLDRDGYRSYYRGIYFASLYRLGLHYLDSRADLRQAAAFDQYLQGSSQPGIVELSTWYGNLVKASQNAIDMDAMVRDLTNATHIGTTTLERTLEDLLPRYSFGSPEITSAINLLASRLDSRITHRFTMASVSRTYLLHLSLGEKLYNSINKAESQSQHYLSAWLGKYYGQAEQIIGVVRNKELDPYVRGKAAKLLIDMKTPIAQTDTLLRQLVEENQENWKVHITYINYLEQQGNYDSALAVALHWLDQANENSNSFDYWNAVIAVSRQQVSLGNTDAAWQAVSSITDSEYGGALYQATRVKLAQGDMDGALSWAKRAIKRYPSSNKAIVNMAEVLWRQGKYRDAAQLLLANQQRFSTEDWRWLIGARFAETFAEKTEEIVPAFTALLNTDLGYARLLNIPPALADLKLFRQAFDTQKELKIGGSGQIQIYVDAYHYLAKAEGREAAIKWLDERIPNNRRNFASMIFFGENQYSLLWDLIPDPAADRYPETVWLYRAAALAQGAPLSEQRRSQLEDYYQNHLDNKYDRMGRYVLGFSDGSDLLDTPMDERTLSESAFYFGVAALRESRLDEACDWFKLATHYSSTNNGEYRWSYSRLYRWKNAGQSMQVQLDSGKLISLPE